MRYLRQLAYTKYLRGIVSLFDWREADPVSLSHITGSESAQRIRSSGITGGRRRRRFKRGRRQGPPKRDHPRILVPLRSIVVKKKDVQSSPFIKSIVNGATFSSDFYSGWP